jgi:hypothetical protein
MKKNLTNKCSVSYFHMYETLVRIGLIEDVDGDALGDFFISLDLNERL